MERRLSAILAADMVGYSRLIEADETGTLERQKAHRRELINPAFERFHGRVVKEMGDGILVEFPSVVDAVGCALTIQRAMPEREAGVVENRRITYRIGINLGDVVVDADDLFGDGVNVAARLEQISEPGGICISGAAFDQIEGRSEFVCSFLGEQQLKNITRSIRAYSVSVSADNGIETDGTSSHAGQLPTDKPSIGVLPFNNFSSDAEQEFFADGIVEDLITALSRFPWLFVIARNSTFSYKGKSVPIKQVAADLGVRYVVEGSIRSSKTRLRVSVQLIEAVTGHHVWADNYDRPVGELFDLQDEITQSIVGVLVPALSNAERERSLRSNRPDLDAWQAYQRGLVHYYRPYHISDHKKARKYFDRAVQLDQGFADAHAMIALMGTYALDSGHSSYDATPDEILAEAGIAARRAVRCDDSNALSHLALGRVCGHEGDLEAYKLECETAIHLNPNLAIAHHELGFSLTRAEYYEEAMDCFDRAIKLSPNDPSRWNFYLLKGLAFFGLEHFEKAIDFTKEAARLRPEAYWPHIVLAASYSALNRPKEAAAFMSSAIERKTDLSVKFIDRLFEKYKKISGRVPLHMQRLSSELKKAGLPES